MNQANGNHSDVASALRAAVVDTTASMSRGPSRGAPPPELGPLAKSIAGEKVDPAISTIVVAGAARLAEFLLIIVSGFAVQLGYVYPHEGMPVIYPVAIVTGAVLAILAFQSADSYSPHGLRSYGRQIGKLAVAWLGVFAILALGAFLLKLGDAFSRVWMALWFLAGLAALTAFRIAMASMVRRWTRSGRLERRAVIVGGGDRAAELIEAIKASPDTDIRICGIFDDRSDDRSPPVVAGFPKLGNIDQLVEFARRTRVDLLIVTLPITAEERLLEFLKKLWVLPVDIRLSAHTNRLRFRPRSYSYIGNVPFIDIFDKPITDWDFVVKWLFDRVIGSALLLLALPVMAIVAIAIKLDSRGPVLFRQKRYGFNNELIEVFKFRSMYVDQCDSTASKLVTKGDPRVTRVGRFIRKTSLDELPQLFNVLRGELSLVGPRPHALQAKAAERLYDEVVDGYFARHKVKPGITGWAQINGWRGETDTPEKIQRRVECDLYYIENWSVLFDLYILAMTPISLLSKTESAY
ncbi:Undecaprenyl-phosphate glucose phosphotransferase [Tepidamorphus gemmatus]|uniref:Undecaprenyl-phosphate glucose phosphotransferase n=1 Tax=Tepidamorphus gemmatus TaxID=747076 RepID=A0A4R3MD47_9HYPH|nr:Undecaprenyl-phosphate glucose phosphotransferase [Tepidamorphus gemmatus]